MKRLLFAALFAGACGGDGGDTGGGGGGGAIGPLAPGWTTVISDHGFFFEDVWGSGPDDVWFVGFEYPIVSGAAGRGALRHFDGIRVTSFDQGRSSLRGVWGTSRDNGVVLHYR
jgi:hypothetical protein